MRTFIAACAIVGASLSGLSSSVAAETASSQTYQFTLIADTQSGAFTALGPFPSINNAGTVAFTADVSWGGTGIFTGSGGPLTTIAPGISPPSLFVGTSINNAGTVAFTATPSSGVRGVYSGNGGNLTTIYQGLASGTGAAINNNNTVAFNTSDDGINPNIFISKDGSVTPVGIGGDPFINDNGTVVFLRARQVGNPFVIYTYKDGQLTPIVDVSSQFLGFSVFPVINNRGTVAFEGTLNTGVRGIFTSFNGTINTIVDSSGPYSSFNFHSINNRDDIAFSAVLDTGVRGIFIGPNPVTDKVIEVGDPLFGSTVADLSFYREGLNDRGQLVFLATLANGKQVIAVASPQ